MKTIYKALIAFMTICMLVTGVNANVIEWNSYNIAYEETVQFDEQAPTQGIDIISDGHIHQSPSGGQPSTHSYEKGTLTIPINNPSNSISINDFNYVDIEIT